MATYYVRTDGTGSWADSMSISTPCSMATAITNAAADDIVEIRAGTYSARYTFNGTGTDGHPITFRGYQAERPVFAQGFYCSGAYNVIKQFEIEGGYQGSAEGGSRRSAIVLLGSHNTVDDARVHNLTQTAGQDAVYFGNNAYATLQDSDFTDWCTWATSHICGHVYDHNTIRNCMFHAATTTKVFEVVSNVLIEDCEFIGPNRDMFLAFDGENSTVRRCKFYGNGRPVGDSSHTETIGFQRASISPADGIIEGNVVDSCVFGCPPNNTEWDAVRRPGESWQVAPFHIFFFGHSTDVTYQDNWFTNNVFLPDVTVLVDMNGTNTTMGTQYFYGNVFHGITGPSLDNANVWRNNICGEGFEIRNTGGGAEQDSDYNLYDSAHHASVPAIEGAHSLLGSPSFTSPVVDSSTRYGLDADWRIGALSDAIAAGIGSSADTDVPTTDAAGVTRSGATTDIGAYLYLESPPFIPRILIY